MNEQEWLAERFEEKRNHLRAVAYRMLGSMNEADDAVQETWLRLQRTDASGVDNLGGWLTTVVGRVCLDMLRSRKSRREEPLDAGAPELLVKDEHAPDPEHDAVLADSVGLALLVVLDTLAPAERLAFVLHDMFAVPFDEIAAIVGRSPMAARQLASRARRRVQSAGKLTDLERSQQREVVEAFLSAVRAGDFEGLLRVLDPDVLVHIDPAAAPAGAPTEIRGARTWAKGAIAFARAVQAVRPAIVDGSVGLILAPGGRLQRALKLRFAHGRIVEVDIIADSTRLQKLELGVLDG